MGGGVGMVEGQGLGSEGYARVSSCLTEWRWVGWGGGKVGHLLFEGSVTCFQAWILGMELGVFYTRCLSPTHRSIIGIESQAIGEFGGGVEVV